MTLVDSYIQTDKVKHTSTCSTVQDNGSEVWSRTRPSKEQDYFGEFYHSSHEGFNLQLRWFPMLNESRASVALCSSFPDALSL